MHIIMIYCHDDNTTTRMVLGCETWADRMYDYLLEYDGPETLAVSRTRGEVPYDRDEDECHRVSIWTERFASHCQIGACVHD